MRGKNTKQKVILTGILVALIFMGAGCQFIQAPGAAKKNTLPPVTLNYWSVFNDSDQMQPVIDAYQKANTNVTIKYRKLNITEYESALIDALATGQGPDIFSFHNTWLPKYVDKLEPISLSQSPINEYVPIVQDAGSVGENLYGLPYSVDTLALYYNPKILASAGIPLPPATWDEFDAAVKKIVTRDPDGNLTREGAAIGTVGNINRGIDSLFLLMLQNATPMTNAANTEATFANRQIQQDGQPYTPGLAAFNKFLSYSRSNSTTYTWNKDKQDAFQEFAAGKLGMLFNYQFNEARIRALNPNLEFRIAPVPQIAGTNIPLTIPSFWFEGVSKKSQHQLDAWKFIVYATGAEGNKLYTDATKKPSSRKDILQDQKNDRNLAAFASQATIAKSWYQKDANAIESVFIDAVSSVLAGTRDSENALQQAETQVKNIMQGSQQ